MRNPQPQHVAIAARLISLLLIVAAMCATRPAAADEPSGPQWAPGILGQFQTHNESARALAEQDTANASGSAYEVDVSAGEQVAMLEASDAAQSDYFGLSESEPEESVAFGSYHDDNYIGRDSGATYVFATPDRIGRGMECDSCSVWSALSGSFGTGLSDPANTYRVGAITEFDDGTGPSLYVGGLFAHAGGVEVNNIAKWNGTEWAALSGSFGTGVAGRVAAMTVFDDGSASALYVAGTFEHAGGVLVNRIAKWDGTEWHALGAPGGVGVERSNNTGVVQCLINGMEVADFLSPPRLVVTGAFNIVGGVQSGFGIASWDGNAWVSLGSLLPIEGFVPPENNSVQGYSVAKYDLGPTPSLVISGSFRQVNFASNINRIVRWDGSGFSPLGLGLSGAAFAMSMFDDGAGEGARLFVGGAFNTAGGQSIQNISTWDGSSWSPVGLGIPGGWIYSSLAETTSGTPRLYIGGTFVAAGGEIVNYIGRWNGLEWDALPSDSNVGVSGGFMTRVTAMCEFEDGAGKALILGGTFNVAGGVIVNGIARYSLDDCDANGLIDSCELCEDPKLDCNANGILDSCELVMGDGIDCDQDGMLDVCQIAASPSLDCNNDGILDSCQIMQDLALDCDADGLLDACQVPGVVADTGVLAALDGAVPVELVIPAAPEATSDVRVRVTLKGDFGQQVEIAQLRLDGVLLNSYFVGTDPLFECAENPIVFEEVMTASQYNMIRVAPNAVFRLTGSPSVSALECPTGVTRIEVQYYYEEPISDCNGNGIPDLCDLEIFGGASLDDNFNFIPDECEGAPPCPGNANNDSIVDFNDINTVIANWLADYTPGTGQGDANADSIVNFDDINAVIANWLSACP